ncbi:cupin domain-containing protein [Kitasatospora sp. MAA4]|uniref:cupin domain-containing protein n=1 Tax=Kitasatospora sp. MAA4 TaxID=3035093 RepID=UPI002475A9EE|nr:cupin domain-containing protein [Kitasatospora sp. MAA4]
MVDLAPQVNSRSYRLGDMELIVSEILPGAEIPMHSHPELQAGMCLRGSFTFGIEGQGERLLTELQTGYGVTSGVGHWARNEGTEVAIGLDLKRAADAQGPTGSGFLDLVPGRPSKQGMTVSFIVGDWFELMVADLTVGGSMVRHKHRHEQFGVSISGSYSMQIGAEERVFGASDVYYTPPAIEHSAFNDGPEGGLAVVGFVPPRYHRPAVLDAPAATRSGS